MCTCQKRRLRRRFLPLCWALSAFVVQCCPLARRPRSGGGGRQPRSEERRAAEATKSAGSFLVCRHFLWGAAPCVRRVFFGLHYIPRAEAGERLFCPSPPPSTGGPIFRGAPSGGRRTETKKLVGNAGKGERHQKTIWGIRYMRLSLSLYTRYSDQHSFFFSFLGGGASHGLRKGIMRVPDFLFSPY